MNDDRSKAIEYAKTITLGYGIGTILAVQFVAEVAAREKAEAQLSIAVAALKCDCEEYGYRGISRPCGGCAAKQKILMIGNT